LTPSQPRARPSPRGCRPSGTPASAPSASSTSTSSRRCASSSASTAWAARSRSAASPSATRTSTASSAPCATSSSRAACPCASRWCPTVARTAVTWPTSCARCSSRSRPSQMSCATSRSTSSRNSSPSSRKTATSRSQRPNRRPAPSAEPRRPGTRTVPSAASPDPTWPTRTPGRFPKWRALDPAPRRATFRLRASRTSTRSTARRPGASSCPDARRSASATTTSTPLAWVRTTPFEAPLSAAEACTPRSTTRSLADGEASAAAALGVTIRRPLPARAGIPSDPAAAAFLGSPGRGAAGATTARMEVEATAAILETVTS
ncbi:hypothetical protein TCAP_06178, partial [Tolypocladium capitatum]